MGSFTFLGPFAQEKRLIGYSTAVWVRHQILFVLVLKLRIFVSGIYHCFFVAKHSLRATHSSQHPRIAGQKYKNEVKGIIGLRSINVPGV